MKHKFTSIATCPRRVTEITVAAAYGLILGNQILFSAYSLKMFFQPSVCYIPQQAETVHVCCTPPVAQENCRAVKVKHFLSHSPLLCCYTGLQIILREGTEYFFHNEVWWWWLVFGCFFFSLMSIVSLFFLWWMCVFYSVCCHSRKIALWTILYQTHH